MRKEFLMILAVVVASLVLSSCATTPTNTAQPTGQTPVTGGPKVIEFFADW